MLLARDLQPDTNNFTLILFWHVLGDFCRFCKGDIYETDMFMIFAEQTEEWREKYPDMNNTLKFRNHSALIPVTHFKSDGNRLTEESDRKSIVAVVHEYMPNVYAVCKLYKTIMA